jgi:hypothetical protein
MQNPTKPLFPKLQKWTMSLITLDVIGVRSVQWAYDHGFYPEAE